MELLRSYVDEVILRALHEDITGMDITSDFLLDEAHESDAYLMAKDDIDMEHIAAVLSLSRKQLRTRVMEITGLTPVAYVLQVRLNYAKRMIMNEDTSLTTIASKCGFQNLSHFSKAFKQQFKVSPTQFRKSLDENNPTIP